jgi:C1A family cysteine protease/PKD repeat protein
MLKQTFILILSIIAFTKGYGQVIAPYAKSFVSYINKPETHKHKPIIDTADHLGYIPVHIDMNFKNIDFSKIKRSLKASALPSKYDLREKGLITSVKDQGGDFGGNCWAFTTLGAIESQWLKMGFDTFDLSEQHLAACHGFEWKYGEGGNDYLAMSYLTRLQGPILESDDPYTPNDTTEFECECGHTPIAYVPEVRWLPGDNIDLIKQTLYDYGALSVSMTWYHNSYKSNPDHSYFYSGNKIVNHAVILAGWDDNYETPIGKGAWIVKNQWGADWADTGYFYISYEDTQINKTIAYYPVRKSLNDIHNIHYYDTLGPIRMTGFNSTTGYGITGFFISDTQMIHKIGTFTNTAGSLIDIAIYDSYDGQSGIGLLTESKSNYCPLPGYYTFDISCKTIGDFWVMVKYNTPDNETPIPMEIATDSSFAIPHIQPPGYSAISSDGASWEYLGQGNKDHEYDLCIRAYSDTTLKAKAMFKSDKEKVCLNDTVTFTDNTFGTVNSWMWNFGNNALPASASGQGPHQVKYTSPGVKTITLIIDSPDGKDTLTKFNYIDVTEDINVFILQEDITVPMGSSEILKAYGADEYKWLPTYFLDSSHGKETNFTPSETGEYKYYVYGTQGKCFGIDSVKISVTNPPDNDNICNAYDLDMGVNGPFSNKFGTVEKNEPHPQTPADTGCTTQHTWCKEYNSPALDNSIWFRIKAPESGRLSISTDDPYNTGKLFDNQIALYKADTCTDILNNNYTLIAANDDYFGQNKKYASAITLIDTLEPNATYWLQLDGSARGVEGECYITISDSPVKTNNNIVTDNNISIYPNPGNGIFNISFNDINNRSTIKIEVFDLNGKIIHRQEYNNASLIQLDLSDNPKSIYLLKIISDGEYAHGLLFLQ